MAFSSEFKNQVISQILSNKLTISAAHREYGIGKSTVHNWLKQVKAGVSNNTNLRAAIVAEGHCQILGFDSPETGLFCRSHGNFTIGAKHVMVETLPSHGGPKKNGAEDSSPAPLP